MSGSRGGVLAALVFAITTQQTGQVRDGLDRAHLIVHQHHRDEHGLGAQRGEHSFGSHAALRVHADARDSHPFALERIHRAEH